MANKGRRTAWLVGLLATVAAAYYALVLHSPPPSGTFNLDLARLRVLADSIPGDKAYAVRYEEVLALRFVEAMVLAGEPWTATPMPVFSYQLVFPDRTIIVDTAMAKADGKPEFLGLRYDEPAYQRMNAAMAKAAMIVITHEHVDHIGGITAHPGLASLKPALRLTAEQVANRKGMAPVKLPDGALAGYEPLKYDDLYALAPGVVLVKSPGHTPGSQMVYVKLADGREILFLGDVSWRQLNVERIRERPLFMTLLLGEDRQAVLAQFRALNDLSRTAPEVAQVPGHDGPVVEALAAAGLLQRGFR